MRLDLFHLKTFKYRYHFHLETVTGEILNQKERQILWKRKQSTLQFYQKQIKKINFLWTWRGREDGMKILVGLYFVFCLLYIFKYVYAYVYIFMHVPLYAYVCVCVCMYLGFIYVYVSLDIVFKSEHVWVFICWLYCIWCTYRKGIKSHIKD